MVEWAGRARVLRIEKIGQLEEVLGSKGAGHMLELLQLMVGNRHMFETMIAFSARYKSAVDNLIKVMEVQQK